MVRKKSVPGQSILQKTLSKILLKINFNTILLALVTSYFTYQGIDAKETIADGQAKQDSVNTRTSSWRHRSDSINKIIFSKLDTIITNTQKHKR